MKTPFQNIVDGENTLKKQEKIPSSNQIATEYFNGLFKNDIAIIMSYYTDTSTLITLENTFRGLSEIKAFMHDLIAYFPTKKSVLILDQLTVESDLIYTVWHSHSPLLSIAIASDTFIIKDQKIWKHTFIGQLNKIVPPNKSKPLHY